jgi:hypothetical protein
LSVEKRVSHSVDRLGDQMALKLVEMVEQTAVQMVDLSDSGLVEQRAEKTVNRTVESLVKPTGKPKAERSVERSVDW